MKQVIINADDFGLNPIYNKGILECAKHGYISSTTAMVRRITGAQAEDIQTLLSYNKEYNISIGLHVEFVDTDFLPELEKQRDHFIQVFGQEPSHLDMHKHTYHEEGYPVIASFCKTKSKPCRYIYTQVINGTKNPIEEIISQCNSFDDEKIYEIVFHPGYADKYFCSGLQQEREQDIQKAKQVSSYINTQEGINLISYNDVQ